MFHACDVKMTKIEANSSPSRLFGKTWMKKVRAIGQKDQDRNRLQHVEDRDEHLLGAPKASRRRAVDEGEDGGEAEGDEHPEQRPRRVVRDVGDVRRDDDGGSTGSEIDRQRPAEPNHDVQKGDDPRSDDDVDPADPASP